MVYRSPWTDAAKEQLKALLAKGYSGTQIAAELGVGFTRNSVIGMSDRMGLTMNRGNRGGNFGQRASRKHRVKPRLVLSEDVSVVSVAMKKSIEGIKPPLPEPVGQRPSALACTIYELTEDKCRWPLWDDPKAEKFYCGGPANGTYCTEHSVVAFRFYEGNRRFRSA